nr:MAG TPA: hypothetical protein [Bacteriophage sp.]
MKNTTLDPVWLSNNTFYNIIHGHFGNSLV